MISKTSLFICLVLISTLTILNSCKTDNSNTSGNKYIVADTPVNEANIRISTINYDNVGECLQNQIEGAGCGFAFTKEGESFFINGLVRINGVYEMLEPIDNGSENLMIYENENWELRLYLKVDSEEGGSTFYSGKMTLRSKQTNQTKTTKIFGGCGC